MTKYPSLNGAGQQLKVFEEEVTYRSRKPVEEEDTSTPAIGDDGYIKRNTDETSDDYDFEDIQIKAAIVENPDEDYDADRLGESVIGVANIYIRKEQSNYTEPDVGDFVVKNDTKWKILDVSKYDTVIKCSAGRMEGDSAYVA